MRPAIVAAMVMAGWMIGGQANAETTIRVIATGEPYSNAMKAAAAVYTERTGIKVEIDQFPYSDAYNKEVLVGSSGSDEYDIIVPDCIWLPIFMKNGWVQSLEPLDAAATTKIDWDGFVPGLVDAYDRWKGERYAAPIDFFIEVLAYRADKFAEAGIAAPPKTWDEFKAIAEKLNDPANDFYGVISMPGEQDAGYSEWTVRLAGMEMPPDSNQFVWNKNFEPAISWNDQGRKALDLWLEIKTFTPPGTNEMGYAESTNAFMQGKGAMFLNWYMIFSDVENPEASKVAGKVAYALPPRSPGDGPKHEYLGGFQIAINAKAKHPKEAYDFIAFLSSDEGQELMLENGAPGAYKAFVYNDPKWLKRYPFLAPVKEAQSLVPLTSDLAEYVEMQRIVYDQVFATWVGDKSSAEAMAAAEEGLRDLFKQLGYAK
ncbi:MAG: extracellular solute-binding protein [Phycisphaerales bacterium]|nr:extracellular solute-binding protein [Phycisphaerales bacterium]